MAAAADSDEESTVPGAPAPGSPAQAASTDRELAAVVRQAHDERTADPAAPQREPTTAPELEKAASPAPPAEDDATVTPLVSEVVPQEGGASPLARRADSSEMATEASLTPVGAGSRPGETGLRSRRRSSRARAAAAPDANATPAGATLPATAPLPVPEPAPAAAPPSDPPVITSPETAPVAPGDTPDGTSPLRAVRRRRTGGRAQSPEIRTDSDVALTPSGSRPARPGDADPALGRIVGGKYLILGRIAEGGMGRVYRARHVGLDRAVCVKTLKPSVEVEQTTIARFEREAKAASRLDHENTVRVFDYGRDESGLLYIAMEYVEGRDLRRLLADEHPLGEERICALMAQVLDGLADAHARDVVHRDLKPENVLVTRRRDGTEIAKVVDFGIAKILEPDAPALTLADRICGTPLYMSPEQATGGVVDARTDIYAAGVILYQLATGVLPFVGGHTVEILKKHVTEAPVPPRLASPEVQISPELDALILRALHKTPERRPPSAEAFGRELHTLADRARSVRHVSATEVPIVSAASAPAPPAPSPAPAPEGPAAQAPREVRQSEPLPAPPAAPPVPRPEPAFVAPRPAASTEAEIAALVRRRRFGMRALAGAGAALAVVVVVLAVALRPSGTPEPAAAPVAPVPVAAPAPPPPGCPSDMVLVPAGRFRFGSEEAKRAPGELAPRDIATPAYCVDVYEFPNHASEIPTTAVTREQAQNACIARGKRLCTETEWERACRGGANRRFTYGDAPDENTCVTRRGGKPRSLEGAGARAGCANDLKLFDFSGNAAEWTSTTVAAGPRHLAVVKGGGGASPAAASRCAARVQMPSGNRDGWLGFRCCTDPK